MNIFTHEGKVLRLLETPKTANELLDVLEVGVDGISKHTLQRVILACRRKEWVRKEFAFNDDGERTVVYHITDTGKAQVQCKHCGNHFAI